MRFSLAITAFLGVVPYVAQALAVSSPKTGLDLVARNDISTTFTKTVSLLDRRADDDEWLMVIYNNGTPENQCGGVANNFSGLSSICEGLTNVVGKICADVSVQANAGFAKCEFKFKKDGTSCGGDVDKTVTVDKGKDSNGVTLSDDVRFVEINCS